MQHVHFGNLTGAFSNYKNKTADFFALKIVEYFAIVSLKSNCLVNKLHRQFDDHKQEGFSLLLSMDSNFFRYILPDPGLSLPTLFKYCENTMQCLCMVLLMLMFRKKSPPVVPTVLKRAT